MDTFVEIADQFQAIVAQFPDDPDALQEELRRMEFAMAEETIILGGG